MVPGSGERLATLAGTGAIRSGGEPDPRMGGRGGTPGTRAAAGAVTVPFYGRGVAVGSGGDRMPVMVQKVVASKSKDAPQVTA